MTGATPGLLATPMNRALITPLTTQRRLPLNATRLRWTRVPHVSSGTALAAVLAIATGLRFAALGRNSLWFDEAFVVWVTGLGWQHIPPHGDFHPPLYYLLMKLWVGIAGTGEAAIRFPSACFSVVCVALVYALARRVSSERVGLLSAFLVSVSPFQIMAGQDARMYSLLAMLALASTLALVVSVDRGGALRWTGYVVLATSMVYTQYLGVFVLIAHGIWMAGYERAHFRQWVAAMAAAVVLYAPWMPSLWYQVTHLRDWTNWPGGVMYRNLLDLLGLYAFGGSLFGMANYFFGGTLGAAEQFIILLPFLAVLWRGVSSLASDRRNLALLGLPPAVTIATMSGLYFAKPIFYPRWFSFLCPFYAMFLAQGIVDAAERFRGQRDRTLAFLTLGLLLYSGPVLARYYFDPGFRPYQWRAAASLVREEVRPGDFFLYVGQAAEIAFTYYFREPYPSLTLTPTEMMPRVHGPATFTESQVRDLAARHPRVWLIPTVAFYAQTRERLLPELSTAFRVVGYRDFSGTLVGLLEARPTSR